MELNGKKVAEGVEVRSEGLDDGEKKILWEAVQGALRRIQYGRKKGKRRLLPYWIELK